MFIVDTTPEVCGDWSTDQIDQSVHEGPYYQYSC